LLPNLKPKHLLLLTFEAEIEKADGTRYDNESIVTDKKKIIVLGSGPNRIGQGIEFDYSCT
jgi:carbamoyl-phosphate synthase large subunit